MSRADRRHAAAKYELTMARARALGMTHGRTRKRWTERVALILYVTAGLIFFVAWAIMLAMLILLLTD